MSPQPPRPPTPKPPPQKHTAIPQKRSSCCDFLILSISFLFTIFVACLILIYVHTYQQQHQMEIEKLIQKSIDERILNLKRNPQFYERKRGDFGENLRTKRTIVEFRPIGADESQVEFFDPRLRPELEKNDSMIMKKNNWKGSAPKGDNWVWLTSYSRIPFQAIDGFCRRTQEYCPPGKTGEKGQTGQKGTKGDIGPVGPMGYKGDSGITGQRGPKGIKGSHGFRGLDGRDGLPGEPGIDGLPGRAGKDGTPGVNGTNGRDGTPGTNGNEGLQGPPGIKGDRGEKGLPGPKGPRGDKGKDGTHGVPGTCMHGCVNLNGSATDTKLYYLPAHIPTSGQAEMRKPIIIKEGDNLRLRCSASGYPEPKIQWKREDGQTMNFGEWEANIVETNVMNFTKVNRVHMGVYVCTADNAVSPPAVYKFTVEVQFKPLVRIKHKSEQYIRAEPGKSVSLSCESEAYPEPVMYWQRSDDLTIENERNRYHVEQKTIDIYKFNTTLTISRITQDDFNKEIRCVSKNKLGIAKISFFLVTQAQFKNYKDGDSPLESGEIPPPKESYESLCPEQRPCDECPTLKDLKCIDSTLLDIIDKEAFATPTANRTYDELGNRTQDCELSMVGKPVFFSHLDITYGAWLRDPIAVENVTVEKIWQTNENDPRNLYEYKTKYEYVKKIKPKKYPLPCIFKGNAHVIYNNHFYYYCQTNESIIKYELKTEKAVKEKKLEDLNSSHLLYSTQFNVVDFSIDDNGMWIIHSSPNSNYTIVSKLNVTTLEIQNSFNVSVYHDKLGEMFIVCGILYGVDSTTDTNTKIRFAFDIYKNKRIDVEIPFSNPFTSTSTIGYNYNLRELYTWSNGNQLIYPVKINALGTNYTAEESVPILLERGVGYSVLKAKKKPKVELTTTPKPT
ncbi:unnamed protein product [Chironomus riparius]|uniref:Colmedin n=1 Tax=Chironomus riparius TaxID=315576 RepID=A0A9N9S5W7_9DIPT|nr:unnamed protein product [Chironomus riparius]